MNNLIGIVKITIDLDSPTIPDDAIARIEEPNKIMTDIALDIKDAFNNITEGAVEVELVSAERVVI